MRFARWMLFGFGLTTMLVGVIFTVSLAWQLMALEPFRLHPYLAFPVGLIIFVAGLGCSIAGLMDWDGSKARP
jgi:uncharacterized transporter YbjL